MPLRGSEQLVIDRWRKRIEPEQLEQLFDILNNEAIVVNDIMCHGQPQPNLVTASMRANLDVFDKLSNQLFALKDCRISKLEAFPHGIPVLDDILVNIEIEPNF